MVGLNVSDVVSGILGQRNPDAKCLCWKIILCSPDTKNSDQQEQKNQVGQLEAGPWLFSKIMPSAEDNNDDDLAITSHDLSIWKKWVSSLSCTDLTCCLSVVKDANCGNLDEAASGASAILFILSYNIPWKVQKAQLHNLLNLVPADSCLPLLVLSGSYNVEGSDPSSVIVNELGLHDIDKSRVSAFLVVFLAGKQHLEGSTGFFSDEKLREGLKWLANESPLQPVLSCVKTHEFLMSHLSPVLEELGKMSDYEVGPNHCISVFNEALDWLMGEIAAAIKANPMNWPCPETMLLKDFSNELLAVKFFLPSVRWSSAAKIAPLEHALKDCLLPLFPDDIKMVPRWEKILITTDYYLKTAYEILEVGCSPLKSQRTSSNPEPYQVHTPFYTLVQEAAMTSISQKSANKDVNSSQKHGLAITDDVCTTSKPNGNYGKTLAAGTETDRLSQLLEKCNIVQNNISEKLSIYF
ncbi:hypothetical protein V6N13_060777 [Hibiscus sabdariffa]|uniref:Uncharacterized protein n=1 Tax=Hibiscus sabdariffa TaxID=183260 RepID=A0ABR2P793_9ROSI